MKAKKKRSSILPQRTRKTTQNYLGQKITFETRLNVKSTVFSVVFLTVIMGLAYSICVFIVLFGFYVVTSVVLRIDFFDWQIFLFISFVIGLAISIKQNLNELKDGKHSTYENIFNKDYKVFRYDNDPNDSSILMSIIVVDTNGKKYVIDWNKDKGYYLDDYKEPVINTKSTYRFIPSAATALGSNYNSNSVLRCSRCSSKNLFTSTKGYSLVKGLAGMTLVGAVGLLGGLSGKNKVRIKCLDCGHEWIV